MEKVVVYGAGMGGKNFLKNQKNYFVVAFCDGDYKKQGTTSEGKNVLGPQALKAYIEKEGISKVIVASMFYPEIKSELIRKYDIKKDMIVGAPKRLLVGESITFENKEKYKTAKKILTYLLYILNKNNVNYYLDFGTLLGFVRDGDFIPWDDDIDISIPREELNKTLNVLSNELESINELIGEEWTLLQVKDKNHQVVELKLEPNKSGKSKLITTVDFYIWDLEGECMFNRVNTASQIHFASYTELDVFDEKARIYNKVEEYLTTTYGDWNQPNENMSFGEHNHQGRFNSSDISKEYKVKYK